MTDTDEREEGLVDLDGDDASVTSVYEVGYHLLPTISEEALPGIVTRITEFLKSLDAVFVGERFPSTMGLAYPIAKKIAGKRTNFETAYFGWIAFEVARDAVEKLKEFLDKDEQVLRFLMVKTDRDSVHAAMSGLTQVVQPTGDIGKPKRDAETGGEVSEVALDEALKTIETEDAKVSE